MRAVFGWAIILGGVALIWSHLPERTAEERAERALPCSGPAGACEKYRAEKAAYEAAHPASLGYARQPRQERDFWIAQCQIAIKATLRNPSSVEWIEPWNWNVRTVAGQPVVEARYRAENGFGGMNVETTVCGE